MKAIKLAATGSRETRDDHSHRASVLDPRRELLKGGGALIVGFSMSGVPALAARGDAPAARPNTVDTWIAIHADNTATTISAMRARPGQHHGLLQIAGEELDLE